MLKILALCNTHNVEFNLRRSSAKWTADNERWSANFEGYNESEGTQIRAEASGPTADDAVVKAWERFTKVASGNVPSLRAIAKA